LLIFQPDNISIALIFNTADCCSSCNPSLDPSLFFLGTVGKSDPPPSTAEARKAPERRRPRTNKKILLKKLQDVRATFSKPTHSIIRPPSWIIDDKDLSSLASAHPHSLTSAVDVTKRLKKSPRFHELYAEPLWEVIDEHNKQNPLRQHKRRRTTDSQSGESDKENVDPNTVGSGSESADSEDECQAYKAEADYVNWLSNPTDDRPMTRRQRVIFEHRQQLQLQEEADNY
jgi:hypothetical protein